MIEAGIAGLGGLAGLLWWLSRVEQPSLPAWATCYVWSAVPAEIHPDQECLGELPPRVRSLRQECWEIHLRPKGWGNVRRRRILGTPVTEHRAKLG